MGCQETRLPSAPDPILLQAEAEGRTILIEPEVYALLAGAGLEVPVHRLVKSPDDVDEESCAALGAEDVVVKVVSPQILHKSDVGGITLCRNSKAAVRAAVGSVLAASRRAAPDADLRGALVVEKIAFRAGIGREVLAGFRHDRAFGPVVFCGVGGLDTEYLLQVLNPEKARDIRSTLTLSREHIARSLRGSVVHAAICGSLRSARAPAASEDALVDLVLRLAALADSLAGFAPLGGLGLTELEVNPFVAAQDGRLVALDGLARLHRPPPLPTARPTQNLRRLLRPGSAVVLGASAESMNPGRIILRNLVEGGGVPRERIWAIHPQAASIDGCRAFPSAASLPEPADMAVVAVPADRGADQVVVDFVENHHAHTVTLISGGFGETEGGREAEARMKAAVELSHRKADRGVLVNGGNCLGIISVPGGYNTFFLPPYKLPSHDAPGRNVASVSQSGAYLVTQISNLDRAVRSRYSISFGNQIDVTVSDYLEYLEGEGEIEVFAVYLEGFQRGDGRRFLEISKRIVEGGRTVLLYKAGRTREGRAAAASHTAAVVGDHDVCSALVRSVGVVDCASLDDFDDCVMTFAFLADRKVLGRRAAVISNAGFECTAAADKLFGLELADLASHTRERLRALLPGMVDVHNPIDATPVTPTEPYARCVAALAADPGVDVVVVAGVPATPAFNSLEKADAHHEDIAEAGSLPSRLIQVFQESWKPMVFSIDSGLPYEPCVQMMKQAGLPCFRKVDRATRAMGTFVAARR